MQAPSHPLDGRVCATEDAPRGRCHILEYGHGLAKIVERGAIVIVERLRVSTPHSEIEFMTLSENTPRHGYHFAQQRLGFI
jgi:hypothetical protein